MAGQAQGLDPAQMQEVMRLAQAGDPSARRFLDQMAAAQGAPHAQDAAPQPPAQPSMPPLKELIGMAEAGDPGARRYLDKMYGPQAPPQQDAMGDTAMYMRPPEAPAKPNWLFRGSDAS